jgi:hypothetical protein
VKKSDAQSVRGKFGSVNSGSCSIKLFHRQALAPAAFDANENERQFAG